MKTNYVSATVMLLAGCLYCLYGIYYQLPLMEFCTQLLIVLIVFWIIGGVIRLILDRFMGEIGKKEEDDSEQETEESEEETDDLEESVEDEAVTEEE